MILGAKQNGTVLRGAWYYGAGIGGFTVHRKYRGNNNGI